MARDGNHVTEVHHTYKTQVGGYKASAASRFDVASGNFSVGDLGGNSVSQSSGAGGVGTSTDSSAAKQQETEAPSTPTAGSSKGADTDTSASQGSKNDGKNDENAKTTDAPTSQGSKSAENAETQSAPRQRKGLVEMGLQLRQHQSLQPHRTHHRRL
ncbi:hypothetical protein P3T76_015465 [Phytophthora citrophthora]|uniref:Uncharacterized protein n=1 Tax=Phytophthora citrophthora TaxID=4793 RepID=A0AAD9FZD9_9STRA|nr:hypothetical protein P3T76_016280 [Phytophthora citrophthora]KAK1929025.1 hypothetical protein P3T76_015465 [Phytophthora citrophthora]